MTDNITLINRFKDLASIAELLKHFQSDGKSEQTYISALHGSTKSLLIKSLSSTQKQIVLILPNLKLLNETKVELDVLGLGDSLVIVDKFGDEFIQESFTNVSQKDKFIIVSTYDIFNVKLPDNESIKHNTTKIESGGELNYDELVEYLSLLNYDRDKYVDQTGQFSVRGSIIDFWSYSEKQPCRVEFDGDFLESVRYYDPENQRSLNRVEFVTLAPKLNEEEKGFSATLFSFLSSPTILIDQIDANDYFTNLIIKPEPKSLTEEIDEDLKEELIGESEESELKEEVEVKFDFNSIDDLLAKDASWIIEDPLNFSSKRFDLNLTPAPEINSNFELLFSQLKQFADKAYEIVITTENEIQGKRLLDLLSEFKIELRELVDSGVIRINTIPIKSGFVSKDDKYILLTDYQVFNKPYRQRLASKYRSKKSKVKDFASIKKGDFVVHENYGIGQYAGLETIKIGMVEQESIKILYAESGVVYVNLNYLGLVKKFSSKENIKPKLTDLGSSEWKSKKKRVKSKIKEAARELIKLYAQRKSITGFKFSEDSVWQKELEASFYYEDTPDQFKVAEEVKLDMENQSPMDRLVCADVGFGKTEIAVRAAFKAVNDGKQVGLLVPTTILAEQHFKTFTDRLSQFPVKVAVLSRFQTKKEQVKIIENLKQGFVDVVIGTHRLLSKDIGFKDLGLLIIDEEHRFGVMAKEKLRQFKVNVDTLTLTATPIPRTLNMSLLGARDLSIISTPPPNRQPIYTKVEQFEVSKIRDWVLEEIKRNGQVYLVHDRVQSIEKLAVYIQKHIPEINIGIAHGQMKPAQLEKVIHDFNAKVYHMLISTKIIESGLDIPNVNTIIINRADRFGLAELHQLRGRVGRSDKQAFAYLLVPSLKAISKKAVKRLQAIEEYTDLGEGFNISMRDLEIRGAGNLLGTEQSGVIDTVGFDLYVKLLDEAVEELKHEEFSDVFDVLPNIKDRSEPTVDTYFEIGIPDSYMPDQADRLGFYSSLFSILKIEEIPEIKEEMEDRFGKIPQIVERLIMVATLRFYAANAQFEKITLKRSEVIFGLPKPEKEEYYKNIFANLMQFLVQKYPNDVKLQQSGKSMYLEMKNTQKSPENALEYLTKFCIQVEKLIYADKSN